MEAQWDVRLFNPLLHQYTMIVDERACFDVNTGQFDHTATIDRYR